MTKAVDWSAYALAYDVMATHNPAYQDIVAMCLEAASVWKLPKGARVVDVGAGTGNFSVLLAQRLSQSEIVHVDADKGMNRVAAEKAARAGVTNHRILHQSAEEVNFPSESVQAIVTVHALYAFKDPEDILRKMNRWLAPGGRLFACDIGRQMNVFDWTLYLWGGIARRKGLLKALQVAGTARQIFLQNWRASQTQGQGRYWRHAPEEFSRCFERAGFKVDSLSRCYRGDSDLILCHKPELATRPSNAVQEPGVCNGFRWILTRNESIGKTVAFVVNRENFGSSAVFIPSQLAAKRGDLVIDRACRRELFMLPELL